MAIRIGALATAVCCILSVKPNVNAATPDTATPPVEREKGLHYFRSGGATDVILTFAKQICGGELASGSAYRTLAVNCENAVCKTDYTVELGYLDRTVYLTPRFDVLFEEGPLETAAEQKLTILRDSMNISVHEKLGITREREKVIADQTACLAKVGDIVLEKLNPYEEGSILANLPTASTAAYQQLVFELGPIDQASLNISLPKDIKRGTPFTLEATIIPSKRLGAKKPLPTLETELAALDSMLVRAKEASQSRPSSKQTAAVQPSSSEERLSATTDASGVKSEYYLSEEFPVALVSTENVFTIANIKVSGPALNPSAVTPEKQTIRPLQATFWSWMITPQASGETFIYLAVSASGRGDAEATRVIPVKLEVSPDWFSQTTDFLSSHIEWIFGSALVPLGIFVWKKWSSRKRPPAEDAT